MSNNSIDRTYVIGLLAGDGIGPEVTQEAVRALQIIAANRQFDLEFQDGLLGGCAIETKGTPLPQVTREICQNSDAVLVGAVGGYEWDKLPPEMNPGLGGLLRLRQEFDLYANLRPGISYLSDLVSTGADDIDIMLVREAVGGAYFSPQRGRYSTTEGDVAFDTMEYSASQVSRIVDFAFQLARGRDGRLTSVDKANVLESSKLWREITEETAAKYPDVQLDHLYVDNCAMQLVLRPSSFDVIVTENLFGDILSDEIAGIVGSLGLLPSASLRGDGWGLYEPVHGAAPDIAGLGQANPTAAILSAAMLLRYSLGLEDEARLLETAVIGALQNGVRTGDISVEGKTPASTKEFGNEVGRRLEELLADPGPTTERVSSVQVL